MKIYSMTATFGKLEHQTITLTPGLNILEAPNEWGKSTWCAFLVNMLYGIDTRARNSKNVIADKERYAPWSGAPMSGRIDLNWNGKDITIERSTRGRLIFGEFKAYETETGIDIPELNSLNCGTTLLGVERTVFERSGFIRLADLPVTQDEALRRRLNSLVTTGDESGAGDRLGKQLKELKNKCRFNRTGLLPQAEAQREQLTEQLRQFHQLQEQTSASLTRQTELESRVAQLENHKSALAYAASQANRKRIADATAEKDAAEADFQAWSQQCEALPPRDQAQQTLFAGQKLQQQLLSLQMEAQMLSPAPVAPESPAAFRGVNAAEAVQNAKSHTLALAALEKKQRGSRRAAVLLGAAAGISLLLTLVLYFLLTSFSPILILGAGGAVTLIGAALMAALLARAKNTQRQIQALCDRYPQLPPDLWISEAEAYVRQQQGYKSELSRHQEARQDHSRRMEQLDEKIADFAQGRSLEKALIYWQQAVDAWDSLGDARRNMLRAAGHVEDLKAMLQQVEPPKHPDTLVLTASETDAQLANAHFELKQLQHKLIQNQYQLETLGQESAIRAKLKAIGNKIRQLEDVYAAAELAQKALSDATTELQRRFAPRISKRAQELFSRLTGGRYQKLSLAEDLSLSTRTEDEDNLRSAGWRSEGTVDQLYLALRLAVAEALTADAPLVLDDALVRFDDVRLAIAMDILKEMGQDKQVILFTCQHREAAILEGTT